jgi:hypothetical protein
MNLDVMIGISESRNQSGFSRVENVSFGEVLASTY